MSNLSLKGITGIYAMGKINQLLEGHVTGADTNRTSYYLVSYRSPLVLHYSPYLPTIFNPGKSAELCTTMAEPHFVFHPKIYRVSIPERQHMGALVQSLRIEVDWGRFHS